MGTRVTVYKSAGVDAAIIAGDTPAMDVAALRTFAAIQSEAARIRLTGDYMRSLRIWSVPGRRGSGRRVQDRVIVSTDPGAVAIELGHYAGTTKKVEGSRRAQTGKLTWVPGKHPMGRAIGGLRSIG